MKPKKKTVVQRAAAKGRAKLKARAVAAKEAKEAARLAVIEELAAAKAKLAETERALQLSKIANSHEFSRRMELQARLTETENDLIDSVHRGLELKGELAIKDELIEELKKQPVMLKKADEPKEAAPKKTSRRKVGAPVDPTKRATGGKKQAKAQINDMLQAKG